MVLKTKVWDTRGKELKTIVFKDINLVDGIWTAGSIEVTNHKTGHRTILAFSDIQYNKNIDSRLFNQNNLKRGIRLK